LPPAGLPVDFFSFPVPEVFSFLADDFCFPVFSLLHFQSSQSPSQVLNLSLNLNLILNLSLNLSSATGSSFTSKFSL